MTARLVTAVLVMVRSLSFSQQSNESDSSSHFGAHHFVDLDEQVSILKSVRPDYPESAIRDSVQGQVLVDVLVDTNGSVRNAAVCKKVRGDLDSAALDAVRQFKYSIPRVKGKPVSIGLQQCINFFLPNVLRLNKQNAKK